MVSEELDASTTYSQQVLMKLKYIQNILTRLYNITTQNTAILKCNIVKICLSSSGIPRRPNKGMTPSLDILTPNTTTHK
jgi:hypothetical protein